MVPFILIILLFVLATVRGRPGSPNRESYSPQHGGNFDYTSYLHENPLLSPSHDWPQFSETDRNFVYGYVASPQHSPHYQGNNAELAHYPYNNNSPPQQYAGYQGHSSYPSGSTSFEATDPVYNQQALDQMDFYNDENANGKEIEHRPDEVSSSNKFKNRYSVRYSGEEWQNHFTREQQNQIYHTVRAFWPQGACLDTISASNKKLRESLDYNTAKAILDGDQTIIHEVAQRTKPPGKGSNKEPEIDYNEQEDNQGHAMDSKGQPGEWGKVEKQTRKKIQNNLKPLWKSGYNLVKKRLEKNYSPSLFKYLNSDNPETFRIGADELSRRSDEGKKRALFGPRRTN